MPSRLILFSFLCATIVGCGSLRTAQPQLPIVQPPVIDGQTTHVLVDKEFMHNLARGNDKLTFAEAKVFIFGFVDARGTGSWVNCVYSRRVVPVTMNALGNVRVQGIDVEHTWPARASWGRIIDTPAHGDLHHLFPASAGINRSRSNLPFGQPFGRNARRLFVNWKSGFLDEGSGFPSGSLRGKDMYDVTVFAPPTWHRGNAARAIFYLSVRYYLRVPDAMERVLRVWHVDDPVDADEQSRNIRVKHAQGNRNPFIDYPDAVAKIKDF